MTRDRSQGTFVAQRLSMRRRCAPRMRSSVVPLLLLAGASAACRSPATHLVLTLGTDIDRPLTIRTVVLRSTVAPEQATLRADSDSAPLGEGAITLPASFSLVPSSAEERNAAITIVLRVSAPATATQPALSFDRTLHGAFVAGTRQDARVFLRAACSATTTGCALPSTRCTLAQRCSEQGQTCDDDGRCGSPLLVQTTFGSDAATAIDSTTPRSDASADRAVPDASLDAAASDVGIDGALDATVSDAGSLDARSDDATTADVSDTDVQLVSAPAPRPLSPLSGARVTSRRPTLRFEFRTPIQGARVELCSDRSCSTVLRAMDVVALDRVRFTDELSTGWHYWRARFALRNQVGVETSPVWQFWVGARSATGGIDTSSGSIGDFNGDGLADLVVGSGNPGSAPPGTVRIFAGNRGAISTTPARQLTWMSNNNFGKSATAAGDVNGDGFVDLVVGAFSASLGAKTRCGAALVFHGSASGLSTTPATIIEGSASNERLGMSVAGVGDVNGDGYADILAGGSYNDTPHSVSPPGVARLYFGSATGIRAASEIVWQPGQMSDSFGFDVASIGDVNADGLGDFAVHSPWADDGGRADIGRTLVVMGRPSFSLVAGTNRALDGVWFVGGRANETFGNVHGGGDLNGDGYSDVAMYGDEVIGDARGQLRIYQGGPGGLLATPAAQVSGTTPLEQVGFCTALNGDINNDGFDDLLIGAVTATVSGTANAGNVYLYAGSPSVLLGARLHTWSGTPVEASYFGHAVSIVGDMTGDNFADIAIGEPLRAAPAANAGRVYLGRGGAAVLLSPETINGSAPGELIGFSLGR